MITYDIYEQEIEKGNIKNGYVFCGLDEELIKDAIELITKRKIDEGMQDLNLIKIDGMNAEFDDIFNACETMPFMSEKKVVVVYRADFLREKSDSHSTKTYNEIKKYIEDIPPYTILIMYYLFNDKRERPNKNKKLTTVGKNMSIVFCDKLKRDKYIKKVAQIFNDKGKDIGRTQLAYFCEKVYNNFHIIKHEADKLIAYTGEREIEKKDIDFLICGSSSDDVFDLVEFIAQKKINIAIDIMRDILGKSDMHMLMISSIQKHFFRLYEIKLGIANGKRADDFAGQFKIPVFVCEKLIVQCRNFTERQLCELIKICNTYEKKLKSSGADKDMEMELLLINTLTVPK